MERERLLQEYEATLDSLVEKTKFVYSKDFYALDEFDKQKYQKDKVATEGHLSTLCNLLWGEKFQMAGGFADLFPLVLMSTMFGCGSGFGVPASTDPVRTLEGKVITSDAESELK